METTDITILIKTFERPFVINRLLESIRRYSPNTPIVVVDDSREAISLSFSGVDYVHTDFDIGISAGKNIGVDRIKTKYFFTCDDDNIFTENTNLEKAKQLLEANDLDILGIKEEGNDYCGILETENGFIKTLKDNRGINGEVGFYDLIDNLFIMKTESARNHKWDDTLKIGEHSVYFHKYKGKLKVGFTDTVSLVHDHVPNTDFYGSYRYRGEQFIKKYLNENGLKGIIGFSGNVIEA